MPGIKYAILSTIMVASTLATTPVLQNPFPLQQDWSPNGLNVTEMRYYLTAFRGLLQGFQQGMLNNASFTLNAACLDDSFITSMINIENALSAGDIGGLFAQMSSIYQIGYNLDKSCNFNELFFLLGQYCYKTNCNINDI